MIFFSLLHILRAEDIYSGPVKISLAHAPDCYIYNSNQNKVNVSNGDIGNNVANIKVVNGQNQIWYGDNQICQFGNYDLCQGRENSLRIVPDNAGFYNIKNDNQCLMVNNSLKNGNNPYNISFGDCVNACEQKFRINTLNQENYYKKNNTQPLICEIESKKNNSIPPVQYISVPQIPKPFQQSVKYVTPSPSKFSAQNQYVPAPPIQKVPVQYVAVPQHIQNTPSVQKVVSQPVQYVSAVPPVQYVSESPPIQKIISPPVQYVSAPPTVQKAVTSSVQYVSASPPVQYVSEYPPSQQNIPERIPSGFECENQKTIFDNNGSQQQNEDVKTVSSTQSPKEVTVITVETPVSEQRQPQNYSSQQITCEDNLPVQPQVNYVNSSVQSTSYPSQQVTNNQDYISAPLPYPIAEKIYASSSPSFPRPPQTNDCFMYLTSNPPTMQVPIQQIQSPPSSNIVYRLVENNTQIPNQNFATNDCYAQNAVSKTYQVSNQSNRNLEQPIIQQQQSYQNTTNINNGCEESVKPENQPVNLQSQLNQIVKTQILQNTPLTSTKKAENCEYAIKQNQVDSPKQEIEYITQYENTSKPINDVNRMYDECNSQSDKERLKDIEGQIEPKTIKYKDTNPNSPIKMGNKMFEVEYVGGPCVEK